MKTALNNPSGDFQKEVIRYQSLSPKMSRQQVRQEVLEKAQVCLDDLNEVSLERGETDYTRAKKAYFQAFLRAGK